jgi:hypothetical protein
MRARRSFWQFTASEARMHALLTAIALWAMALGVLTLGTTHRDPFGQLKWTDFVHFYTLGHVAEQGPVEHLYDGAALHRDQVALVPASAREFYFPVYPPQTALMFAPFSHLPYRAAGAAWALVTIVVFSFALWLAWRPVRGALGRVSLLAAAAAAFPPLQNLVLNGQTTAVPIVAFACGAWALAHGRKLLAGLALGLLFIKPQFGLVLAVVVLACREWSILAGLALSAAAQAAAVAALLGRTPLVEYAEVLPRLSSMRGALEPRAESMQSITAVTGLLPGVGAAIGWLIASAAVCWMVVRVWRSSAPVPVRAGALVLGSMLVNPHVNLYDAAVIAPALVSLSGWLEAQDERWAPLRHRWHLALYALYALLLFPAGRFAGLQLSPLVLLWMTYAVWRVACEPRAITAAASVPAARLLAADNGPR